MLHPELQQEIIRREGDSGSRVTPEASDAQDADGLRDALWQNWLIQSAQLQDAGFSPNTLCDGVNSVATVRAEFTEQRQHAT